VPRLAEPGPLVGRGRSADVFEYGPDRVLRRYRAPRDTEREVAGMEHARRQGFPAPAAEALSDTDIVMERLRGPTMLEELGSRPWRAAAHAALLASLHNKLHAIEAPSWLPEPMGPGSALLHFDLHPDNVILTENGPEVIDWPNVARGPSLADVAFTCVILTTAAPLGGRLTRLSAAAGRGGFRWLFMRHFAPAEIKGWIPGAARFRLEDRSVPAAERRKVARLAER
jgi:aminoglycoside phosphotransferase (APT) family kinase protein